MRLAAAYSAGSLIKRAPIGGPEKPPVVGQVSAIQINGSPLWQVPALHLPFSQVELLRSRCEAADFYIRNAGSVLQDPLLVLAKPAF